MIFDAAYWLVLLDLSATMFLVIDLAGSFVVVVVKMSQNHNTNRHQQL